MDKSTSFDKQHVLKSYIEGYKHIQPYTPSFSYFPFLKIFLFYSFLVGGIFIWVLRGLWLKICVIKI